MFLLEIIGEILVEGLFSWIFDSTEHSSLGFVVKSLLRFLLCGLLGVLGYFFLYHNLPSGNPWLIALGILLLATAAIVFIIATLRSLSSLRKKRREEVI